MGKVITLQEKEPEAALEGLKRLTGLDFHSWPASLLEEGPVHGGAPAPAARTQAQAQELPAATAPPLAQGNG